MLEIKRMNRIKKTFDTVDWTQLMKGSVNLKVCQKKFPKKICKEKKRMRIKSTEYVGTVENLQKV